MIVLHLQFENMFEFAPVQQWPTVTKRSNHEKIKYIQ
jgi:hypothetical protein